MPANYLDADVLARIRQLELAAKRVVEGVLAGAHKSPRHGFAVEFAQHREYVPGDDIKHLDWKVFGKTERYYLKQYELETDFTAWMVIDASASMRYASVETSKYDYACVLAASLSHLVLKQADRVGMAAVGSGVQRFVRAAGHPAQIGEIVRQLAVGPTAGESQLGKSLTELAGRIGRRSMVMLFSDFLDDPAELAPGLRRLKFDKHEVVAVRVLDPAEEEFPFTAATLFRGLEIPQELLTDPRGLRRAYLKEFESHRRELRQVCRGAHVELLEWKTTDEPGLALARYLAGRE